MNIYNTYIEGIDLKTNISLPEDDICKLCNEKCPANIYDCPTHQKMVNEKKAVYLWCWVPKPQKKK